MFTVRSALGGDEEQFKQVKEMYELDDSITMDSLWSEVEPILNEKAAKMMADLRSDVPATIGGAAVTGVRDYKISLAKDLVTGEQSTIDLPKSNVLELLLGEKGSVIARPSGTEPKVKFYYTAVGKAKEDAKALLDKMVAQMSR
mgnify:CR=1 FL=1